MCVCVCVSVHLYVCVCACVCLCMFLSLCEIVRAHLELLQKDHIGNRFINFWVFNSLCNISKKCMQYSVFSQILLCKHTYKQAKVFLPFIIKYSATHSKENVDFFKNKMGILSKSFLLDLWYKMTFFKMPTSKI